MPMRPLAACATAGCPNRVRSGHCAEHARQQENSRDNVEVRRWYRTSRWKRLRYIKWEQSPWCVDCRAEGVMKPWTDLDHQVPHRGDYALFWDPKNLVGRCHEHHSAKTRRGA